MARRPRTLDEMVRYANLRYVWRCPNCHYEYEDVPGTNEGLLCPRCGRTCEKNGETYAGNAYVDDGE